MVPTLEIYKKIADAMDMSVHHLFELLDENAPVDLGTSVPTDPEEIQSEDLRLLVTDLSKLTPAQQKQARQLFRAAFMITNPELFNKGDDDK